MLLSAHMYGGKRAHGLGTSVREVVFGLEDSLVSTLGAVSGVAVGSGDVKAVILAGLVLVFVEAISMAAGSYLSTKSSLEFAALTKNQSALKSFLKRKGLSVRDVAKVLGLVEDEETQTDNPVSAGLIMGFFYILGGLLVLFPYLLLPLNVALPTAVVFTVAALFLLGVWKANVSGTSRVRSGMEMLFVSVIAAAVGILIGRAVTMIR